MKGRHCVAYYKFLFADLNALYLSKYVIKDAFITKELWGGFAPSAKFINGEQVFNGWILIGCGLGNFRVWGAKTMLCKDLLRFLREEEIDKCLTNLAGAMLIHIGVYNRHGIIDADRGGRENQFIIYAGLLTNQHFILVGNRHIANTLLEVSDGFARSLVHHTYVLQHGQQEVLCSRVICRESFHVT